MPVGVPKVAFRLPGDANAHWVDLYNRLYRQRVLFLGSDLDDELSNQLVGILVYLSAEEPTEDIYLYINSPGGAITCGLAVFDMMQNVEAKVHTISVGIAASMASFVLSGGEPGLRMSFPHARVMIHQPIGGSLGQASDIVSETFEVMRLRRIVANLYIQVTGCTYPQIHDDMGRDFFLAASEAKDYGKIGIVDYISEEIEQVAVPDLVKKITDKYK